MLQLCCFVPLLADDTPKPMNVPKKETSKEDLFPNLLLAKVFEYRQKIATIQRNKIKQLAGNSVTLS